MEAEPSALFKAQERMNDLVYKNTKRVIGAGDVLLKVDMKTESLSSSNLLVSGRVYGGFQGAQHVHAVLPVRAEQVDHADLPQQPPLGRRKQHLQLAGRRRLSGGQNIPPFTSI